MDEIDTIEIIEKPFYTRHEAASILGTSDEYAGNIFLREPDTLVLEHCDEPEPGRLPKRKYVSIRIPHAGLVRVIRRMQGGGRA